jgi:hypothetical protein
MKRFERSEQGTTCERLQAFTKALWQALVPASGECASVQGELVRVHGRLVSEFFREGMGNYYCKGEGNETLAGTFYGQMVLFMLDTLSENRGQALDDDDVAYFAGVRGKVEPDWVLHERLDALSYQSEDADSPELTDAEKKELAELEAKDPGFEWEELFDRAERCTANWCLANHELIDRKGRNVQEGGVGCVMHVFDPPPPPPPCPLCKGRGWLAPTNPTDFPAVCSCKQATRGCP